MKKIITIGGFPGSGKSTIADAVAEQLSYDRFSSGDFMRELAAERGVTLAELSAEAEKNPAIDKKIDAKNKEFSNAEEIIIDSRLGWHFLPDSFSVYLDVDPDEATRRIHGDEKDTRSDAGDSHETLEETKAHMLERFESERKRYKKLYNLDHTQLDNYDLVIDTTDKSIAAVTQVVIAKYQQRNEQ